MMKEFSRLFNQENYRTWPKQTQSIIFPSVLWISIALSTFSFHSELLKMSLNAPCIAWHQNVCTAECRRFYLMQINFKIIVPTGTVYVACTNNIKHRCNPFTKNSHINFEKNTDSYIICVSTNISVIQLFVIDINVYTYIWNRIIVIQYNSAFLMPMINLLDDFYYKISYNEQVRNFVQTEFKI